MEGGSGADTYHVDNKKDRVVETDNTPEDTSSLILNIDLGSTVDSVISSVKYTLTNYIENLTLAESSAKLAGTGNELGNEITGNAAANKLAGKDGSDTIDGGAGADKISGGSGADTFLFTNLAEGGADAISDFADEDLLSFDTAVFSSLAIATGANFIIGTAAVDVNDYLIYNDKASTLYYDADGSGGDSAIKIVSIKGADAKTLTFDDCAFV
jgi:Ca2+-binding RTX toxin-like protein